jgi:hypothetical protein
VPRAVLRTISLPTDKAALAEEGVATRLTAEAVSEILV